MKKLLAITLAALLLLCSCGSKIGIPDNALNTPLYCQINDTIYMSLYGDLRAVNNAIPDGFSLCFDPLCDHSRDTMCANMNTHTVITDGKRLYVREGEKIYSLNPDGTDIRYVADDYNVGGIMTGFSTDGENLYYVNGLYNSDNREESDSYGVPMTVPCKGGIPKKLAEGDFSAYATAYADEKNYYIADIGTFTVIDRKTEDRVTVPLEAEHCIGMYMTGGKAYVYVIENYHPYEINSKFNFQRNALLKWDGEELVPVISDIQKIVFDHEHAWYIPMLEVEDFELIGTKDTYDGRGMSAYDFIRTWENKLICRDLTTGKETVYTFDNPNLSIEPFGMAGGYIIAMICDFSTLNFNYSSMNLKPEADGTITLHDAIKAEREAPQ